MKKHLIILGLGLSLSAHAADWFSPKKESKPKNTQVAAITDSRPDHNVHAEVQNYSESSTYLRLSPTMNVLIAPPGTSTTNSTVTGFGLGVDLLFVSSAHMQMGLELGFSKYSDSSGDSGVLIPLMYTLLYQFNPGDVSPYVGFSAGVEIVPYKNTTTTYSYSGTSSSSSKTSIIPLPTIAFRPGVNIPVNKSVSFFAEAKMGVILIIPFIAPQAGVSIGF